MPSGAAEPIDAFTVPPRLAAGSRVALVSPAGPLRDASDLQRADANARRLGFSPVAGPHALARDGYFAGDDEARLADLTWALTADDIDGIWCARGGYGAARLLPALPAEQLRARPRALLGYSDITALHALWRRAGVVSLHGPTARAVITPFSERSLRRALDGEDPAGAMPDATTLRPGVAEGTLAGGNLALVASLAGTPWAFDFRDAIVVLEDINEATYRLDRMLVQLRQSGAFDGCAGLLLGQFTNCPIESDDGSRTLQDVMLELAEALDVPAVLGAPVGHVDDQWTLPLGARATLDSRERTLQVHPLHTPPAPFASVGR